MVIAAPIVAVLSFVFLYGVLQPTHRGPTATYWNRGREALLPKLHRLASRLGVGYAAYELQDREYAGRIDAPVEDVDTLLAAYGFERMPLSAWKTLPDGRSEAGSWARRDGPLADRQLHVMLFRTDDGATDCYVHDEYNAFHPRHAAKHYHGIDYSPRGGHRQLQELIGDYLYEPTAGPTTDAESQNYEKT
jgi:hypothetical protein